MSEMNGSGDQNATGYDAVFSNKRTLRDLLGRVDTAFDIAPDAEICRRIADALGLLALRKLRFSGELRAEGKADWRLDAKLGATVQQACVVTSDPVITRIDIPVARLFLRDYDADVNAPEAEFDGYVDSEPLESEIDLGAVMIEALSLAVPDYPRKPDAKLDETVFSAPGTAPMRDEDTKPFASLAALRDKLDE